MSSLRIIFMGTPDFAVASLKALLSANYEIVGVVTAADKPAGRGRKLQESAVKKYALQHDLLILQPTNLKDVSFNEKLQKLKPDLVVVVAFRMLPKEVWQLPKLGTFNLHASLLPDYRGAAPINWAIINGEVRTGVTTFFIDDKIDTGEIILQETTTIGPEDTAGDLHDKLMMQGASLVVKTVGLIENGKIITQSQKHKEDLKPAPKIHKDTCRIDWEKPLETIYNHIRGLSPYPSAWTTLFNGPETVHLKVYNAQFEHKKHNLKNGSLVFSKKELSVAVEGGFLSLLEIQLPGKRRMRTTEVLNGLKLEKTAYLA